MTRTTLHACLLAALTATSLSACDSNSPDGGDDGTGDGNGNGNGDAMGQFEARVTGSADETLEGIAGYAVTTEEGQTATVVGLVDDDDERDVAVVVLKGAPRTGTFTVTPDEETATAGLLLALADGTEEGALYAATGGTVTVTRAAGGELEGRFEVEAVSAFDESETVTVEGTFDAEEGEFDPEARALAARR